MSPRTLVLTRDDIAALVTMDRAIGVMAQAFRAYATGAARQPAKLYLDLPEHHGDFRAMPAYLKSPLAAGLKWVNVHERNARRALPTVMGLVILNDPRTGFPYAILDGTTLTSLRTGATGGLAAKLLARRNSRVVGLIGCGEQARTQLAAVMTTHRIAEVYVWGPQLTLTQQFVNRESWIVDRLTTHASRRTIHAPKVTAVATIAACVQPADIIVTTTPSRRPLVHARWLKQGVHINAIGADAPGKRELARDVVEGARVIVDDWVQAAHGGELNVPAREGWFNRRHVAGTLGDIAAGRARGRRMAKERTIFDSTGLAIQDIALAAWIYREAIRRRRGRWVRFF